MATHAQINANRRNSQSSTGPRTEAGKAKSCINRLSHGFTSNTAQLIDGEDPAEFNALLSDLISEYQPATMTEQILVERMCQNQWISGRAFRLMNDMLTMRIHRKVNIPNDLGLFIRYQSNADRQFHKAHTELVKVQKEREKSEIGFESQKPVDAPAAAPPPPKTPSPTVPEPPPTPDFISFEDQLADVMNEPLEEMARAILADYKSRKKVA